MQLGKMISCVCAGVSSMALVSTMMVFPAGAAENHMNFQLDWTPNTNQVGIFVAQHNGYFKDAGVTVNILPFNDAHADSILSSGAAIYLADRVIVLSARPTKVRLDIEVNIERPRKLSVTTSPEFLRIEETLIEVLHEESRNALMRQRMAST